MQKKQTDYINNVAIMIINNESPRVTQWAEFIQQTLDPIIAIAFIKLSTRGQLSASSSTDYSRKYYTFVVISLHVFVCDEYVLFSCTLFYLVSLRRARIRE